MRAGAPSRTDPVLRTLSAVVGGPAGDRTAGHPWWGPARVLLAITTGVLALGMAGRSSCVSSAWSDPDRPFAKLCWSELAGASASRGGPGAVASYVGRWAERVGTTLVPGVPPALATAAVLAVVLAAVVLVVTLLLSTVDDSRPWAAAGWAASPVLAVHWLSWDLLAAAGVALLLFAWTRGSWVAAVLGLLLAGGFGYPIMAAEADTGSVWLLLGEAGDTTVPGLVRTAVLLVAMGAAGVATYAIAQRGPSGDVATAARLGLVVLGVLLLVAPSVPPEAALLLLPLAAFAVPRWRDLLIWQACELLSWVLTGWYLGEALTPGSGGDSRVYWVAVLLRLVGVGWLVAAAVRAGLAPGSGDDDAVEGGRREPDPHVDLLADAGHAGS